MTQSVEMLLSCIVAADKAAQLQTGVIDRAQTGVLSPDRGNVDRAACAAAITAHGELSSGGRAARKPPSSCFRRRAGGGFLAAMSLPPWRGAERRAKQRISGCLHSTPGRRPHWSFFVICGVRPACDTRPCRLSRPSRARAVSKPGS